MDRAVGRNRSELNIWLVLAAIFSTTFFALFFLWPTGSLIYKALIGADESFGVRLAELFGSARFVRVVLFSFGQAAASALITLIAAWPLTWAIANRKFWGRQLIRSGVTVAFVLPTVVVAAAVMALSSELFGSAALSKRSGFAGLFAILAAHVFFNIAVVLRTVGSHWTKLDRSVEEAAAILGAGRIKIFWSVTWPRLRAAVISALAIVFFFSFTSFAVILLLGGPTRSNLETEIYRYALIRGEIDTAAVLAFLQILAVAIFVIVDTTALPRLGGAESFVVDRGVKSRTLPDRIITAIAVFISVAVISAVPLSLVLSSLHISAGFNSATQPVDGGGFGLAVLNFDGYRALGERVPIASVSAVQALRNSFAYACVAAVIAAVVGVVSAVFITRGPRRLAAGLSLLWTLPIGVSALTLGFGILITFARPPFDWRSSWFIVPVVHALIGSVFVIRSIVPVLRSIRDDERNAARLLSASPLRVLFTIDLAKSRTAFLSGIGFAFAVSLGEFGATSFLSRNAELQTVPILIARLLATPGVVLRRQAMALSVVLMVVTALAVHLTSRLDRN